MQFSGKRVWLLGPSHPSEQPPWIAVCKTDPDTKLGTIWSAIDSWNIRIGTCKNRQTPESAPASNLICPRTQHMWMVWGRNSPWHFITNCLFSMLQNICSGCFGKVEWGYVWLNPTEQQWWTISRHGCISVQRLWFASSRTQTAEINFEWFKRPDWNMFDILSLLYQGEFQWNVPKRVILLVDLSGDIFATLQNQSQGGTPLQRNFQVWLFARLNALSTRRSSSSSKLSSSTSSSTSSSRSYVCLGYHQQFEKHDLIITFWP